MAVVADTQKAVEILHGLQGCMTDSEDAALSNQIAMMISLMDSPSFKQLLNLQQAIGQLKEHIASNPSGHQEQYDFSADGELVFPEKHHKEANLKAAPQRPASEVHPFQFVNETYEDDEIVPTRAAVAASAPSDGGLDYLDDKLKKMAYNRDLIHIDLIKPENGGLGFSVIGLKGENVGDLGIFVQKIQPNSVADRDGRLKETDQILSINGQVLDTGVSHKEAISMLQQIKGIVHLIVAHGDFALPSMEELNANKLEENASDTPESPEILDQRDDSESSEPLTEVIVLVNEGSGLGFGIVSVQDVGIVVKTIVPGGAADKDGRLQSCDIIIKIGDTSLEGMNSTDVATVLRQSGTTVTLTVLKNAFTAPPKPSENRKSKVEVERMTPQPTSPPPDMTMDESETDLHVFEVNLEKTSQGLGLSIFGFEKNRPDGVEAGIFIKAINEGSAAAQNGQLMVGDQIMEVDGQSVKNFSNREAVELLRSTGTVVHLKLARRVTKTANKSMSDIQEESVPAPVVEALEESVPAPVVEALKESVPAPIVEALEESVPAPIVEALEESVPALIVKAPEESVRSHGVEALEESVPAPGIELQEESVPAVSPVLALAIQSIEIEEVQSSTPGLPGADVEVKTTNVTMPSLVVKPEEVEIKAALWQGVLGLEVQIVIAGVTKASANGSLGISLEGRVDLDEHGNEIQPRHYIRSVLDDGPVGKDGRLRSGDELLEVNGVRLFGRNHMEVVEILRTLPANVCLVCARHPQLEADTEPMVESVPIPAVQLMPEAPVEEAALEKTVVSLPELAMPQQFVESMPDQTVKLVEEPSITLDTEPTVESAPDFTVKSIPLAAVAVVVAAEEPAVVESEFKVELEQNKDSEPEEMMQPTFTTTLPRPAKIKFATEALDEIKDKSSEKEEIEFSEPVVAVQEAQNLKAAVPALYEIPDIFEEPKLEAEPPQVAGSDTASTHSAYSESLSQVSHESLMGLSLWSEQVQAVTLIKGEQGLGFSILDYQDPLNPDQSVILIRSLVEGGVAERDGRLIAGDRLMSVNDTDLAHAPLDEAVEAIRGAKKGVVKIGVSKPLPATVIQEQREALAEQAEEHGQPRGANLDEIVVSSVGVVTVACEKTAPDLVPTDLPPSTPQAAPRQSQEYTSPEKMPPAVPVTSPPHESPLVMSRQSSTSSSGSCKRMSSVTLPSDLERTIELERTNSGLGLTVSVEKGNGAVVKTIIRGGCIYDDNRLFAGDYITAVNGESMRELNNSGARGLLRKYFLNSSSILITYIPAAEATAFREKMTQGSIDVPSVAAIDSVIQPQKQIEVESSIPVNIDRVLTASAAEVKMWEEPRIVDVYRKPNKSLGISIVGGRVGEGRPVQGIFIKHVLEDSPAGQTDELKTGDRILEVNDCDLREASHDEAVAVIKNAYSPVRFIIQSMTGEAANTYKVDEDDSVAIKATVVRAGSDEDLEKSDDDIDADTKETTSSSTRSEASQSDSEEDEYGYTRHTIQERYGDLDGEFLILDVTKTATGLGVSLAGNKHPSKVSVFVVAINPEGGAAEDGRLQVSDEILEVNGIKVFGHTHREASMIIQDMCEEGLVKLVIRRRQDALQEMAVPPLQSTRPLQIPPAAPVMSEGVLDLAAPSPASSGGVLDLIDGSNLQEESDEVDFASFPNVHKITLNKGGTGLGFFIYEKKDSNERSGIFVKEVSHGGAASKEGSLRVNDQILAVNDLSLIGLTKLSAISVLKDTRGTVELTLSSSKPPSASSNPYLFPGLSETTGESFDEPDLISRRDQLSSGDFTKTLTAQEASIVDAVMKAGPSTDDSEEDTNPLTRPILPKIQTPIIIDRGAKGLGLEVAGGSDTDIPGIIIDEVLDGAAKRDGRLKVGDQLLAINDKYLNNVTNEEAQRILERVPALVPMIVFRAERDALFSETWQELNITLHKQQGKGLGLSIVSRSNDRGVFISDIVAGGITDQDGRLMRGDRLLMVNGEDVVDAKRDAVAQLLKRAQGAVDLKIGRLKEENEVGTKAEIQHEEPPQHPDVVGESGHAKLEGSDAEEEDPNMKIVELERGQDGLGFSIVGGYGSPHGDLPIYIKTVFDRGAAVESKKLKRGDQILAVNEQDLVGATHEQAVNILKKVRGRVVLKILVH